MKKIIISTILGFSLSTPAIVQALDLKALDDVKSAVTGDKGGKGDDNAINWDDLATTGASAEIDIYVGTKLMNKALANMAEALDLKEEAASLNAEAEKISDDGSISGSYNLSENNKKSETTSKLVVKSLNEANELSLEQKKALGSGIAQYAVGGLRYVKGVKSIKDVVESAKDAPLTQVANFVGLIKLAPTALKGAQLLVTNAPALVSALSAKDVAEPAEMKDLIKDSGF